jgi:hypothetical protein
VLCHQPHEQQDAAGKRNDDHGIHPVKVPPIYP